LLLTDKTGTLTTGQMVVKKVLVGTKHWPLNTDVKKVEANKNAPDSKDLDSDSDSDSSEPEDTPAGSQRGKNARTNLSKQAQNQ
jgi:magnesium-transporting ATPase (P-type)